MQHHELFLRPQLVTFQPPTYAGGSERACIIPFQGLTLRKLSADEMEFDASGSYRQSWAMLPNYQANGIQYLYGFEVQTSGEGTVEFQLSPNNGTTWYYYKTTPTVGWTVATSTDWNTAAQVDLNLPTFPITLQKQVRVKVRLTPATLLTRPTLHRVTWYTHLEYD